MLTSSLPQRIVCLSAETTETLYLLGQQHRIAGISGFTTRPPQARREKPRVAAFTTADLDKIHALQPDLVIGFSDLQQPLLDALASRGIRVHWFDQRSIADILQMIRDLGVLVGCEQSALHLANELAARVQQVRANTARHTRRPRIYFEEWDEPMITSILWVSELIEVAGGENCFAELAHSPLAKNRIITDARAVIARAPDIIIGSWCGKKFQRERVTSRAGWNAIPAVVTGDVYEVRSSLILQPGPGALTEGLDAIRQIIDRWRQRTLIKQSTSEQSAKVANP